MLAALVDERDLVLGVVDRQQPVLQGGLVGRAQFLEGRSFWALTQASAFSPLTSSSQRYGSSSPGGTAAAVVALGWGGGVGGMVAVGAAQESRVGSKHQAIVRGTGEPYRVAPDSANCTAARRASDRLTRRRCGCSCGDEHCSPSGGGRSNAQSRCLAEPIPQPLRWGCACRRDTLTRKRGRSCRRGPCEGSW